MTFTPPAHTPYAWQNAPSTATPLDAAHLEAAETDLVNYTQSALTAYDTYAQGQFSGGPFVRATTNGISATNTAAANATALAALIGSSGVLGNGGTLICDWDGTVTFDTTVASLTPNASLLTIVGRGWGTVMRLAPEGSTNSLLPLWSPGGSSSMHFRDICLQGPDTIGSGGANALVRHTGTSGALRFSNVWLRRATFLVELNPSVSGSNVSLDLVNSRLEGYGTVNSTTCIGAFDPAPTAWTPTRRVSATNCHFFNFGDPAGGALRHAIYVYTSWGLHVNGCLFHTPATTNTGFCIQHFDSVVTGTAIAQESRIVDTTFGADLGTTKGVWTNYNYPTTFVGCNFQNGGLTTTASDIEAAGDVVITNCGFTHKNTQNIELQGTVNVQVSGSRFQGALGGGCGSIYNNAAGAVITVNDCRFSGGTGSNGAYCWLNSTGELNIRDCRFEGSPARAILGTAAGKLSVEGSRFVTGTTCVENNTTALAELHVRENDFAPTNGASGVFNLAVTPVLLDIARNFGSVGYPTNNGGTSTQTPGAVTTVTIAHGLGNSSLPLTPAKLSVTSANANARGVAFSVSADNTNITLTFGSALTAATSYSWAWIAER